ncbi:MAG TPA: T9SS type A sorting domain-containing protein [Flavisolibacter sp.]|jgi:hypothetical protein|nr:T9SS type A sorting domain-containing protein [Flavisolibacter sp.]
MRRIFTSTIFIAALAVASFSSNAQTCTQTTVDFNTGTSTQNFTGAQTSGTGSFSPLAVSNNQLRTTVTASSTNTYAITSATYSIPNSATSISFTFTYGSGPQATISGVQYAIRYVSTTTNTITQTPLQTYTNSACTSVTKPVDFSGNNYQVVAIYTVISGNGSSSNGYISYDNFGTNGTQSAIALPVKFQSLDARPVNSTVSLKWNVATEENLSGYSIERSTDGRSFSQIAFVGASGQSDYSFVDGKPTATAYYRIKSVDLNGRIGYSTVALVKSGKSTIVLKAFPSPVIKSVSIQHPTATAGTSISVSSADGRVMKTIIPAAGMQQTEIDLSGAKAGLYLVRYNSGSGESETLKVLKQ